MATRLRPRKWDLLGTCTAKCSINEANIGEERAKLVHGWFEEGLNDKTIAKNAFTSGFTVSHGAVGRHRQNHMEPKGEIREGRTGKQWSDLEIIDNMIQAGGDRADQFKMTPSETMKAMELKYKLTAGSAFEGMLDALNRAAMEEDDLEPAPNDPSIEGYIEEDDEEDVRNLES
jgi:hypothetical protein